MADEVTVTDKAVTDDDLNAAWNEANATEEKTEEPPKEAGTKTEEKPPETASAETQTEESEEEKRAREHKESSNLGRKIKGLEARVERLMHELETSRHKPNESVEEELPEVISTPDDVYKVVEARIRKEQKDRIQYQQGYMQTINEMAQEPDNEDIHDEVMATIASNNYSNPYNNIITGKPDLDARMNYEKAAKAVLKKKISGGETKLPKRDTAVKTPISPAAKATTTSAKAVSLPKLDEAAQDYVNYLRKQDMSDEQIAKEME